jgi:uncharacterized membrane protein
MAPTATSETTRDLVGAIDRLVLTVARHWLLAANSFTGLFLGLAIAAPLLMAVGLMGPARLLYRFYALNCHQLPQRSYFLLGPNTIDSYSLEQVLSRGADPGNLRAFVGNAEIGFKMAVAHRITAIFAGALLGGLLFAALRRFRFRLTPRPGIALMVPLVVDGASHIVSELTGLGFRESNAWAYQLAMGAFRPAFYTGTGIGALNWLLRTATGVLFGLAIVWMTFPHLSSEFSRMATVLDARLGRAA